MSILIKGIDMPKDYVLRIEIEPNGTVWEEGRDWIKHKDSAIQIPRPHGRLIDERLTYIDKTIDGYFEIYAPTILEAEE